MFANVVGGVEHADGMSAQREAGRSTRRADHPSAYSAGFFKRARWASNSSMSAMPTKYQQIIS